MAKNENGANGAKKGTFDKMCDWYASQGRAVGIVYSLGAAVVIVGALFKIQHLPGAGPMLFAGMLTEALLFTMGVFEKPHPSYHWENVFPGVEIEDNPCPLSEHVSGAAAAPAAHTAPAAAAPSMGAMPALSDGDLKGLQDGIANLAKTAGQLANLGAVAEGSAKLSEKLATAAEAAGKFTGAQDALNAASEKLGANYQAAAANVEAAANAAATLGKSQEGVNAQVAALNAVYELQLKAVKETAAKAEAYAATVAKLDENAAATLKSAEAVAAAQSKLAQQVADLNKVYGNMLNAVA